MELVKAGVARKKVQVAIKILEGVGPLNEGDVRPAHAVGRPGEIDVGSLLKTYRPNPVPSARADEGTAVEARIIGEHGELCPRGTQFEAPVDLIGNSRGVERFDPSWSVR